MNGNRFVAQALALQPHLERRHTRRQSCPLIQARCQVLSGTERTPSLAPLVDISAEGLGLVVPQEVDAGAVMVVKLAQPDASASLTAVLRVQHVAAIAGGRWMVGGRLAKPFTATQLSSVLGMAG